MMPTTTVFPGAITVHVHLVATFAFKKLAIFTMTTTIDVNKSSAVAEMGDRGHNRHGPKRGGGSAVPHSRSAGNPSNTMWPAPMSTSVPSGVFIHPAVWPQ